MGRLRRVAGDTPSDRERVVDLLRAVAIVAVVLGHWTVTDIGYDDAGRITGQSALPLLPDLHPLTWLAQVIPIFFLVGGYANAASWTSHRRRGGDTAGWLHDRSRRLLGPITVLLAVLTGASLVAGALDADPVEVRMVSWFATIPLWFLAAYLAVVALTPLTYRLHRRRGPAPILVLVGLVGLGDVARLNGLEWLGNGSYLFGWLAIHQAGFVWRDATTAAGSGRDTDTADAAGRDADTAWRGGGGGAWLTSRWFAAGLAVGGLAIAVLLTSVGPYPVSMINIPGERLHNMSPPSLALLALATAQIGVILLLRRAVERWLRRSRSAWLIVVAVNAVILTIFAWHVTAEILLIGAADAVGWLPVEPVGTSAWWWWRLPWLLALAVMLLPLVIIFGPVETRAARAGQGRPPILRAGWLTTPSGRLALCVLGYAATVAALVLNNTTPNESPVATGVPVPALLAYAVGLVALGLARPDRRPARVPASP